MPPCRCSTQRHKSAPGTQIKKTPLGATPVGYRAPNMFWIFQTFSWCSHYINPLIFLKAPAFSSMPSITTCPALMASRALQFDIWYYRSAGFGKKCFLSNAVAVAVAMRQWTNVITCERYETEWQIPFIFLSTCMFWCLWAASGVEKRTCKNQRPDLGWGENWGPLFWWPQILSTAILSTAGDFWDVKPSILGSKQAHLGRLLFRILPVAHVHQVNLWRRLGFFGHNYKIHAWPLGRSKGRSWYAGPNLDEFSFTNGIRMTNKPQIHTYL